LETIWLAYIVAALAASAFFVLVGWRSRVSMEAGIARSAAWLSHPADAPASESEAGDPAEAIRAALERHHGLIREQCARVEIAAEAGLCVRARGDVLADMVAELLALGVRAGAGGHFLFTASRHAGRVDISLSDDCPTDHDGLRRSQARTLEQQVALQGGSLEIVTQPGQGTTMTIRLASAAEMAPRAAAPTPVVTAANQSAPAAQLL
jgi:hypothetical protein